MKSAEELFSMEEQLQSMADRLARLGYPDAASETMETLLEIRQARIRIGSRIKRLSSVWQSVEWCDSGDCSEDAIKSAIEQYRK